MRVLHICSKTPFPPVDGGTIASYHIAKSMLQMGWQVKLLSIVTPKHPKQEMPLDEVYAATHPAFSYINTTPTVQGALSGFIHKSNYLVSRFFAENFAKQITAELTEQSYDIVLFDGLFTTVYLDTVKKAFEGKTIIRTHNIEFHLWEDRYHSEPSWLKRFVLQRMIDELKEYELSILPKFDIIATISETDKAFLNSHLGLNRTQYLPFGITPPADDLLVEKEAHTIRFIGALDWEPNVEGLHWFLNEVWPIIHERNPKIKLEIGGRNAPKDFLTVSPEGVTYVGQVEDAKAFMSGAEMCIVPLLSGSGIRIKIIEALFLGQTIVTTHKGAQGITFRNEKELFVTDTPKTMARYILNTVGNTDLQQTIGMEAKKLAHKLFHMENTINGLKTW